jgi:acyl-homoserine lactone acylase PvdQ
LALASSSVPHDYQEVGGSNGWAIAPSRTKSKNAMLLINPHSEFYGRIEIHLVSEQGLNAYGAPFLGQFNIFQGFN